MAITHERHPSLDGWVIERPATPEHGPQILGPGSVPDAVEAGVPVRHRYASEAEARAVAEALEAHYARLSRTRGYRPYCVGLTVRYHEHTYTVSDVPLHGPGNTGLGNT
jgi:hypothetical protein